MSDNTAGMGGLRPLRERVRRVEEEMAQLRHDLTVKPGLVERLVAIGYPQEQAVKVVDSLPRETAADKVSLREGLATIDYTVTEIEECMEDVPELKQADIDHAREILAAWNPETTALNKTWHGDRRLVVFPKIDTSNVTSINAAWGGCPNLRYFPLLDTSNVTTATAAFYDGTDTRSKLRRLPAFDFSSLTGGNGGMLSYHPELEILPHLDFPKCKSFLNSFRENHKLTGIDFSFIDTATFDQTFCGMAITAPVVTDFKASASIQRIYASCPVLDPDFSAYTFKSTAPKVNLCGLFFITRVSALPKLEFNNVSDLSYFLAWSEKAPKVIPDMSMWTGVTTFNWFLGAYDNLSAERIEGLDFSSVKSADFFIITQRSPYYFPNLRYIRIINLGKGSCATYDFTHARYWGEDTPEHPDARKSLVDTLLTDSYDRAAAAMSPITVRLHSLAKNRLTTEERAAITAKGITLA